MKVELKEDFFKEGRTIYDVEKVTINNNVTKFYIDGSRTHSRWVTSDLIKKTIVNYPEKDPVQDYPAPQIEEEPLVLSLEELEKIVGRKIQIKR